jgi:hypothetical protein
MHMTETDPTKPVSPGADSSGWRLASWLLFILNMALLGLMAFDGFYAIPRFKAYAAQVGASLPVVSQVVASFPSSVYCVAAAVLTALLIVLRLLCEHKVNVAINGTLAIILLLLKLLIKLALWLPVQTLSGNVKGP